MGQLVLAAKVSHVPSLMLSEAEGSPLKSAREGAVRALRELGRRARDRGVSTFVVFDTHWLSNFGYHINANPRHQGSFTSHEAPQMIRDLRYDLPGDTALAEAIAKGRRRGLGVIATRLQAWLNTAPSCRCTMNPDGWAKVVSVASPLFTSLEESRLLGEATRRDRASGERVAVLASGSLSHRLWPNKKLGPEAWTSVASEFNRQVDLRVLELWQQRRYREFVDMLPDYAVKCNGEGGMADTIMLFAALGWDGFDGAAEQLCEYFPSSGSGQVNVEFHVDR